MIDPDALTVAAVPSYMADVLELAKHAVPGTFTEVAILHDHDCPYPTGRGACRCRPEVKTIADHLREEAERN
jgi:hypothetical protein